jgi:uncharacterized membrane protein (UPF0182 family)
MGKGFTIYIRTKYRSHRCGIRHRCKLLSVFSSDLYPSSEALDHNVVASYLYLTILYYIERRVLASENQPLYKTAKIHLSVVIFMAFWVQAWGYMLERHMLLYNTNNEPLFFGPGYTEMTVILPLIWLSAIFLLAMAISLIVFVNKRKGIYPLVIFTICVCSFPCLGRTWDFLPQTMLKNIL